jgi:O-antigen/teichoic acid export membrane protein
MSVSRRIQSKINALLPHASFARNVGTLAGGTSLAQAFSVLALPVITRLYTPEDFSVLAVYAALLSMTGVVACLRFEIAIPIPADGFEAANLAALALLFTTLSTLMIGLVVLVFSQEIAAGLGQPALQSYLWLLVPGVWLTGSFACVQYLATRSRKFREISRTRLTQAVGSAVVQIAMGWLTKSGPLGLLLGQVTASGTGFISLAKETWVESAAFARQTTRHTLSSTFRKYSRFPKFSTFESLANNANIELPILIIAAYASGPQAGFALVAMKAVAIPLTLIGSSISQVYLSHAPERLREGKLPTFTQKIIASLFGAGVGPLIGIGILAPAAIPLVFGPQWERAGILVAWMTPWFALQILSSPISMALHVTGNQRLAMVNQVWGLILRVGMTLYAAIYIDKYIVEAYCLSGAIFYLGYLMILVKVSGINTATLLRDMCRRLPVVGAFIMIAYVIQVAIQLST